MLADTPEPKCPEFVRVQVYDPDRPSTARLLSPRQNSAASFTVKPIARASPAPDPLVTLVLFNRPTTVFASMESNRNTSLQVFYDSYFFHELH